MSNLLLPTHRAPCQKTARTARAKSPRSQTWSQVRHLRNGGTANSISAPTIKLDKTRGRCVPTRQFAVARQDGRQFRVRFSPGLQPVSLIGARGWMSCRPDHTRTCRPHADLDCTLTPTELTQLSFSLLRSNKPLGQLTQRARSTSPPSGRVKLEVSGIDRRCSTSWARRWGWISFRHHQFARGHRVKHAAQSSTSRAGSREQNSASTRQGAKSKPVDLHGLQGGSKPGGSNRAHQYFTLTGTQDKCR